MINRRGFSDDGLGMAEALNEVDSHGLGLNISVQFFLKFSKSMEDV